MGEVRAETLGDRVERAIERHADTPGEIERGEQEEERPHRLRRNVLWLGVTGVSLYLVFPSVVDVFGSWRQITRFSIASLAAMAVLQVAAIACLWDLQRVALRAPHWRPVIASQLASNALSKIAPGGGPMGAALQYRMLVQAGLPGPPTVTALTAVNLLVFAVVLALPVLAIPALLRGGVNRSLLEAALARRRDLRGHGRGRRGPADRPTGRCAGSAASCSASATALRRKAEPLHRAARAACCASATGSSTRSARAGSARCSATVGRWVFDYMSLLAALAAIGSHPRPGLVLLAFCGGAGAGADPGHARRAGVRRGRPDRDARARGRRPGRRRAGDVRLPPVLVLAPAAARPRRAGDRAAAATGRGRWIARRARAVVSFC